MKTLIISAVLSLMLPASAMSAPRNDPFHDDPILASKWGAGDPELVVQRFSFELHPTPPQYRPASYDVGILAPVEDETVFSEPGALTIQATISPPLADGDQVEFLLDGEPVGPPTKALEIPLSGLGRGQHMIQARVIDATGNVGAVSMTTVFYLGQAAR